MNSNYNGTINLSCSSSALTGINCTTPSLVDIPAGTTTVNVTVTLSSDTSIVAGEQGVVLLSASDETSAKTSKIDVYVVSPGGLQLARYNASYGAPYCDLPGTSCSSGDILLYGRGPVTPELNHPNT